MPSPETAAKCTHCGTVLLIADTTEEDGDLLAKDKPPLLRALLHIALQMLEQEEDLVGAVHAVIAAAGMARAEMPAVAAHGCFSDALR